MKLHFLFQCIVSYFLIAHALVEAACPPEGPNKDKLAAKMKETFDKMCEQKRNPGVDPKDALFVIQKIAWPVVKELDTCTKPVGREKLGSWVSKITKKCYDGVAPASRNFCEDSTRKAFVDCAKNIAIPMLVMQLGGPGLEVCTCLDDNYLGPNGDFPFIEKLVDRYSDAFLKYKGWS